jgi:hypothetical protein
MQLVLDCIEWELQKEINRIPNGNLERVIRATIKDLEKRKNKATRRPDTGICGQILKPLEWFLIVIFAIRNGRIDVTYVKTSIEQS